MYVILVYDVDAKKDPIINKFLKRYLTWVQNSVFEGELSKKSLDEVKSFIESFVTNDESVKIYEIKSRTCLRKETIGLAREPTNIV